MTGFISIVLDTSVQGFGLGLVTPEDGLLESRRVVEKGATAKHLDGALIELLQVCSLSVSDLKAIRFNRGPGSFTGLRIGAAWSYGLMGALGDPMIGLEPLGAIASSLGAPVAMSATRRHGFFALPGHSAQVVELDEPESLQILASAERHLFSVGWPDLQGALPSHSIDQLSYEEYLTRSLMAMADSRNISSGINETHAEKVIPELNYLRLSTAEQRLIQARKKKEMQENA